MKKKKKLPKSESTSAIHDLVAQLNFLPDIEKHIRNDVFAQELYGMLCTNIFIHDLEPDTPWACDWVYAKTIVDTLRKTAGIIDDYSNQPLDLIANNYIYWYTSGKESVINTYVKTQLSKLGWTVRSYDDDLKRPQNN